MLVPRSLLLSLALLAMSFLGPRVPPAEAGARIDLRTAYLAAPVGPARQVRIEGELGGTGRLTLDPNTCTLDRFGDPRVCTEIAPRHVDVALRPIPLADPAGGGRRLFALAGAPQGQRWTLVVPGRRGGVHRLVVDLGQDKRRVLTLEAAQARKRPGELAEATYTATRIGGKVVVVAQGQNPTPGYENWFESIARDSSAPANAPHYRLLRRRPEGMAATVMTPFETRIEFELTEPAPTAVVVFDRTGRHVVAIEAPK